jgi:hypothetical protein
MKTRNQLMADYNELIERDHMRAVIAIGRMVRRQRKLGPDVSLRLTPDEMSDWVDSLDANGLAALLKEAKSLECGREN